MSKPNKILSTVLALSILFGCSSKNKEQKYQELIKKADAYLSQSKLEEARLSLLAAADLKPSAAVTYFKLGDVFVRLGQFGKAAEYYKDVIDLNPQHRDARLRFASLLVAGKQFELAESHVRKLLEANPKDLDALIVSANLQTAQKRYSEARTMLELLKADNPKNYIVLANLADIAVAEGKLDEAEQNLHAALEIEPNIPPLRLALADLYTEEGRLDEAQEIIQSVLKLSPNNSNLRYYFGDFLLSRGLADNATAQYEEILKQDPLQYAARDRLYDLYLTRKEIDKAKALSAALAGKLPANDAALLYFAGRDAELDGKRDVALTNHLKAIEGMQNFAPVFRHAGMAELALGKPTEAVEHLNQAIALDPVDIGARLSLARYLLTRHEFGQATEHVKKVLERYPHQLGATVLYADLLLLQGDTKNARTIYDQLVKSFPENPIGYVKLGVLAEKENNTTEALAHYRHALSCDLDVLLPGRRYAALIAARDGVEKALSELASLREQSKTSQPEFDFLRASLLLATSPAADAQTRALFEQALSGRPQLLSAYLGLAELDAREKNYQAASGRYKKILEAKPDDVPSRMLLALSYEKQGDIAGAQTQYREILKQSPRFPPAANNLAWLLAEDGAGDLDQALELAMIAKEGLPDESSVADTLGWVYYRKGASRAALPLVEEAIQLEKKQSDGKTQNPEMLYHLGAIKAALGDKPGAKEALEQAVKLGGEGMPRLSEAKQLLEQVRS